MSHEARSALGRRVSDRRGVLPGAVRFSAVLAGRTSGLEAADRPGGAVRQVLEAIVEAVRTTLPELPALGSQQVATPEPREVDRAGPRVGVGLGGEREAPCDAPQGRASARTAARSGARARAARGAPAHTGDNRIRGSALHGARSVLAQGRHRQGL